MMCTVFVGPMAPPVLLIVSSLEEHGWTFIPIYQVSVQLL